MPDSSAYNRPEGGWRMNFGGVRTSAPPDALNPDKYPYAQNVRSNQDGTVETRPGYSVLFQAV